MRLRLGILSLLLFGTAAAPAPALVGGTPTTRDLPHMVAMEFRNSPTASEWSFRCGGSLVAPDVVLTAAHCVSGDESSGEPDTLPAAQFRFLAGTKKRSQGGERIVAVEIREHPSYDGDDAGGYDVALVRLERSSKLGRPIAIAGPADMANWGPGKDSLVTGWGANAFQVGATSDDLEEIVVPIRSDEECAATSVFAYDPATMLCAGETLGGKDSCQGDSGGPLMVPGAAGGFVLVADVSFGFGCAFPTQYGVYGELAGAAMRPFVDQGIASMSRAGGQKTATPVSGTPTAAPGGSTSGGSTSGGSTSGGSTSGGSTSGGSTSGPAAFPTRSSIRLPARVRRSTLRVRVRTSEPLRRIRLRLVRGRRTVATRKVKSVRGAKTVKLKRRAKRIRTGRATLRLTARDAAGRRVTAARRVKIRR